MNGKEYRKAMEYFTPAPGLRERTAEAVERRGRSRGRFGALRTGLVAAAMCLALVGTAFAATAIYRLTAQTYEDEERWGQHYTGYRIYGEPVIHPVEDFSQQLQDDFAAWNHPSILFNQEFGTWEEVRAYLGANIPAVWHSMDSADGYPVEYRVQASHEMYGDNKIKYVEVLDNGIQLCFGLNCFTEMYIYTPDYSDEALTGEGWWKDEADWKTLDSYAMANGCMAEVVMGAKRYEDYEGEAHDCIGVFMKDGILYRVSLHAAIKCPLDETEMENLLHQVLDSFR